MALIVKHGNGTFETISESVAVGVEVAQVARQLEVGGVIIARTNTDGIGVAAGLAPEGGPGLPDGSIWTNPSYNPSTDPDPEEPFRRWKRTINMKDGNVGIGGKDPRAMVPAERLVVVGNILATGDVQLSGADCAEDFDIEAGAEPEPGTVMIIGEHERLRHCIEPYDAKVAGVVSGAGTRRPGIILGRQSATPTRIPVALTGTVYCKVDALYAPVGVGDLLTTSATPGHAMKALDARKAFGAILGKALRPLTEGRGLIPVLVALQ